jgi:predicted nucleic acid-binding protein
VYLVDTSVLTRLAKPGVAATLLELDEVSYSPISALEYRYSAANERDWNRLGEVLDGFVRVPIADADFQRADEVQRLLASAGLKGRKPPVLIIAAQAERVGFIVVHYDRDFEHIASVTQQRTLWIAPPGSID